MSGCQIADRPATRRSAYPYLPALILALGSFLSQFDTTAVVVALPSIAVELAFGVAGSAWVMDAYSLAFTAFLLAAGSLADKYGRRRSLLLGNVVFALASLGCGLAWDGWSLWAARALQGAGAAFIVTGAIALIAGIYPTPVERARAFAMAGLVSGASMALGPTLGGLAASTFGWRWIFFVNLPACALVAWAIPRLVAESRDEDGRPLDVAGIALLTGALGAAILVLLHARSSAGITLGVLASLALGAMFVLQQRRRARPMIDPRLFASPPMLGVAIILLMLSVAYWALLVYLPLFLQSGFALSPEQAGMALLGATLPMLLMPPLGGRAQPRWGWRRFFVVGLATVALGDAVLVWAAVEPGAGAAIAALSLGMALIGVGAGLLQSQLSGAMVALVPAGEVGMASALTVVMRQGGFALGIAALGAALGAGATPQQGFAGLFALAAATAIAGLVAALTLVPRPAPTP
jgi:MFS family permease